MRKFAINYEDFFVYHGSLFNRVGGIQGTANAETGFVEDVGVNRRRGDIFVSEKFLDGADVVTIFEQVGGETVMRGAEGYWLLVNRLTVP